MSESIEQITFGQRTISFALSYSDRKSLGITVNPDSTVVVKAPINAELEKVLQKVKKRAPWIIKQQNFFASFKPLSQPRQFLSGETHLYLGKQYRLKLLHAEGSKETVKLIRGYLQVFTDDRNDQDKVKSLLDAWYRKQAARKIAERFAYCTGLFKQQQLTNFDWSLRTMPTRWGSCSPSGRILVNPELIKAPVVCIDYVIVHELCHLVHSNHGKLFFQLQEAILPNWKSRKEKLELLLA